MAPRSEDTFAALLVADFTSLVLKTCNVDAEPATAREANDEASIKQMILDGMGGFDAVNKLVMYHVRLDGRGGMCCAPNPLACETAASALQEKLARLLMDQAKFDEAAELFRETLAARCATLGGDHMDTLACIATSLIFTAASVEPVVTSLTPSTSRDLL